jgi:hypothetical protein
MDHEDWLSPDADPDEFEHQESLVLDWDDLAAPCPLHELVTMT